MSSTQCATRHRGVNNRWPECPNPPRTSSHPRWRKAQRRLLIRRFGSSKSNSMLTRPSRCSTLPANRTSGRAMVFQWKRNSRRSRVFYRSQNSGRPVWTAKSSRSTRKAFRVFSCCKGSKSSRPPPASIMSSMFFGIKGRPHSETDPGAQKSSGTHLEAGCRKFNSAATATREARRSLNSRKKRDGRHHRQAQRQPLPARQEDFRLAQNQGAPSTRICGWRIYGSDRKPKAFRRHL
jgi:hypothetical protein